MKTLRIIRMSVAAAVVIIWILGALLNLPVINREALDHPTVVIIVIGALTTLGWDLGKIKRNKTSGGK